MARSIIEIFFNNLLINIPSSLITTKLNLINIALNSLAFFKFSQIKFYFKLYTLKSLIKKNFYNNFILVNNFYSTSSFSISF